MDGLKDILKRVLKTQVPGYSERELELTLFNHWTEIVGGTIAKNCWPVKFVDGKTLLIASESPAWIQNLKFKEFELLDRFEEYFEQRRVQKLVFKIGSRSMEK